jgi:hypothetical protein
MNYKYTIDERVNFYLGNMDKRCYDYMKDITPRVRNYIYTVLIGNNIDNTEVLTGGKGALVNSFKYIEGTLNKLINDGVCPIDKTILVYLADQNRLRTFPMIAKTRLIDDNGNITIAPIGRARHYGPVADLPNIDCKVSDKCNKIVWRGHCQPMNNIIHIRQEVVSKFAEHKNSNIDIGYSSGVATGSTLLKNKMTLRELLRYRFNISLEGNDVATNLKWILASNSIAVAPRMTTEGWFMESKLEPWVHYIPLDDDCMDIEDKLNWGISNPDKCIDINKNANKFMLEFVDIERENEIFYRVLKSYIENIHINI